MRSCRGIVLLVVAVSLSLIFPGCATSGPKEPVQTPDYSRFKGYKIRVGESTSGSFDTPPYIPTKIRFWLEQLLEEKKLLASDGDKKTLTVNVRSSALYSFVPNEYVRYYNELTSTVEVVDTSMPAIVAKTTINGYNAWGEVTSDFTEVQLVRDIVKFLETIVS